MAELGNNVDTDSGRAPWAQYRHMPNAEACGASGGRPPRGLGRGASALPWATAAAVGPGGGDRLGWGHIRILYKTPTDYTKPQQTIQSPDKLYKAPERLYKAPTDYTKPQANYTKT